MVELFMRVWFLCAIAFLAGSAVTWLLFVRTPRRRPAPPPLVPAPRAGKRGAHRPRRAQAAPPPEPPPPAEPALANLDAHRGEPADRNPGTRAAGALDRLGAAGGPHVADGDQDAPRPTPEIPAQGRPVDEPAAGEGR